MDQNKIDLLNKINNTLKKPHEWPGVFLPIGAKCRDDVMFLAEMPSMIEPKKGSEFINFNASARDRFFVEMLCKYNLSGVYVTDIVKKRAMAGRPTKNDILLWRDYLINEIKIIDPIIIIVIGKTNYEKNYLPYIQDIAIKGDGTLNRRFVDDNYIYHYCSQVTRAKFESRLMDVVSSYKSILS